MTNANVKKEKERKEQQKTNHTLKLTITKILTSWNKSFYKNNTDI